MRAFPLGAALALAAGMAVAQETPRPAAEILTSAETAAAAQHKSIFLIFHASW